MKRPIGGIVQPFHFTEKQRAELIGGCWKNGKSRQLASTFLDSAERVIEVGLYLIESYSTGLPRAGSVPKLESTITTISRLLTLLDDIDEQTASSMNAEFALQMLLTSRVVECQDERDVLRSLFSPTPFDIWAAEEVLQAILAIVKHCANKELFAKHKTGPKSGGMLWLAVSLAECYGNAFGKPASAAENGNFSIFIRELNQITGYEIGKSTIKSAILQLKNRQSFSKNCG